LENAVKLNVQGIKCDNKDCDYREANIPVEEYIKWLNKPCPKCGANLLTQADYDNIMFLMSLEVSMNKVMPQVNGNEKKSVISVEMNGTGDMNLVIKE